MHNWAELADDLLNPQESKSQVGCYRSTHSISWAVYKAILASQLNTLDPTVSSQNRFDGNLRRQKNGLQEHASLFLFRDDVERLLRDLHGDIESEALNQILGAVFTIVEGFAHWVRKDLRKEYDDAVSWDLGAYGIGLPEGYGISGSEHRRAMKAIDDLKVRAHEVIKNPSAFSRYTVEFAKYCDEQFT